MPQQEYYRKRTQRRTIEGYFYINGKRLRRTLCKYAEIGLDDNGDPTSKSKRALNQIKKKLLVKYQKLEAQLQEQKRQQTPHKYPLLQVALQEWLDNISNPQTKLTYSRSANRYLETVGNVFIDKVSKKGEGKCFRKYLDEYRLVRKEKEYEIAEATKATCFTHIQSFWNWAEFEYELPKTIKLSNRPKPTKKLPITLSGSQKKEVYNYIKQKYDSTRHGREKIAYLNHLRAFIISQEAYLRAGEILRLRLENIDIENRYIRNWSIGQVDKKTHARMRC